MVSILTIFRKSKNIHEWTFHIPAPVVSPSSQNVLLEFHRVIEQRGMHPYERGEEEEEEKNFRRRKGKRRRRRREYRTGSSE